MRDSKQDILTFWFEETTPHQWFTIDSIFDQEIKDRFELTYQMSSEGLGDAWLNAPDGALALCLLLDQFPRHMYRGTPQMFLSDAEALSVAKNAINRGFDQMLNHEQRFFLYLPFEHSEKMEDQKRNLKLFESMAHENPIAYTVAKQRFDAFEKFGRFPERNAILGRENTAEEEKYLQGIGTNIKL